MGVTEHPTEIFADQVTTKAISFIFCLVSTRCARLKYRTWHAPHDEIACFRISETWRKHAAPWFRYIYVLRKRENSNLRDSVTSPERKCQVTFPSYLSQQISAVVCFRHVSANGSAVVCYIYQNANARWFFEQQ